jgi:hypothetical protein
MLKPTPTRVTLALLGGLLLILIAAWSSDFHGEICEQPKPDQEHCTRYNLAPFLIIEDFKALDTASVAITSLATAVIAWFTRTIWKINKSQLEHAHQVERSYLSGGGVPETRIVKQNQVIQKVLEGAGVPVDPVAVRTGNFELHINNHGKTPGQLLKIGFNFCEADAILETPDYQWHPFPDWIGPGTQSRRYFRLIPIPRELRDPVIYVRFRYLDIFGGKHSCGFIQRGGEPIRAPDAYTDWD